MQDLTLNGVELQISALYCTHIRDQTLWCVCFCLVFGQKSAFAGDVKEARRLKKASYVVSVIGFVVGLAILIVFTIHVVNFMKTLYQARGFDPSLLPPPSFTFNTPP